MRIRLIGKNKKVIVDYPLREIIDNFLTLIGKRLDVNKIEDLVVEVYGEQQIYSGFLK